MLTTSVIQTVWSTFAFSSQTVLALKNAAGEIQKVVSETFEVCR